jgi:hypothetical protein
MTIGSGVGSTKDTTANRRTLLSAHGQDSSFSSWIVGLKWRLN